MVRMLKSDILRIILSYRLPIGIIATSFILILSLLEGRNINIDVLYAFEIIMYGIPAMLILIAGAYGYADSIYLDIKNNYYRSQLMHVGLHRYIFSKVISVFVSSTMIITLGITLFAVIMHLFVPWCDDESMTYNVASNYSCFKFFLNNHHYILFFLLSGFRYGLLSGILSVLSAYVSLFAKNRMIVFAFPFIGRYLCDLITMFLTSKYTLYDIFWEQHVGWKSPAFTIFILIGLAASIVFLIGGLMMRKIERDYIG